jgi:membrane protease YdiL (CAAX protease family)
MISSLLTGDSKAMLQDLIRLNPVLSFFVLALAITWIAFIHFYLAGGETAALFTFGPFVAAVIVSAIVGGRPRVWTLLRSIAHWRVGPIWYLVAIGFPIAVQLLANWLNPVLGSGPGNWSAIPPAGQIAVTVAILAIFSGPLGEEPGWRGFAVPELLQRHAAVGVSLMVGIVWSTWHLPLALLGEYSLFAALLTTIAAFVFTWLWQNTQGSVLLAILMHVSHQNSARFLARIYEGPYKAQQQWITFAIWLAAAVVIVVVCGTRSFRHGVGREL